MSDELDFVDETRLIRRWLNRQTVPTDALAAELRKWADYWTAGSVFAASVVADPALLSPLQPNWPLAKERGPGDELLRELAARDQGGDPK